MDAYDWDLTIFRNDSTAGFFLFCMRRYPAVRRYAGVALRIALRHYSGKPPIPEEKQSFYRYLAKVPDVAAAVKEFWGRNRHLIGSPAMPVHPKPGDVVISAGGYFLLQDICDELGLHLIATHLDPMTGQLSGIDCYGEEKVRRFREEFGDDARVSTWYSDSMSDAPMAALADRAFLVRRKGLVPWPGQDA